MTTKRQIEANRRNARKSTGPKTPAGKARSAQNATKHGLTSRQVVLADESAELYEEMRRNLQEDLRPGNQLEQLLVNRLAAVQWRLARVPALEAALFERLRAEPAGGVTRPGEGSDDSPVDRQLDSLGVAWERDVGPYGGALGRLVRYETALERNAGRLLAELRRLQAQRAKEEAVGMREAQARVNARHYAPPAAEAFITGPGLSRMGGTEGAGPEGAGPDGAGWREHPTDDWPRDEAQAAQHDAPPSAFPRSAQHGAPGGQLG